MPTVSVIIPFFNRIEWMLEAVESVLTQTFHDLELIIVDDGSTEQFDPALLGLDPRILYVRQENLGPAAARNSGIAHARGQFIAFLDADDMYLPRKLEVQVRGMLDRPDAPLSHTSYTRVRSDGSPLEDVDSGSFEGWVYPRIVTFCPVATPTVMVRRAALGDLRFEERFRAGEDVMLWLRVARAGPIVGIREPLSLVRIHGGNAVFDPLIQLRANMDIVENAMALDPGLDACFRARAHAIIYRSVATLHARRGAPLTAAAWCLRAVPEMVHGFGVLSLPGWALHALRGRFSPSRRKPDSTAGEDP
jgi:glycosyltransferase involved in cell wall biosynthesis